MAQGAGAPKLRCGLGALSPQAHWLKAMGCSSAKERYGTPAAVIPPVEPKEVKDRPPEADSKGARPAEWQRPATWPARKKVPPPGRDAPHVVLSTKFVEPWGTISRGFKEILEEKGCTVYNPNTVTWTMN